MLIALAYFTRGLTLGLSAGFSPGPFTTLVISESLTHGGRAGARMALAPFITDPPIILASLLVLSSISNFGPVLAFVGLAGALVLSWMGWKSLRLTAAACQQNSDTAPPSLRKGILVNFTNPNPYLFWLTICGPQLISAYKENPLAPFAFLAAFYAGLVGVKTGIAFFIGRTGHRLPPHVILWINRALGLLLWAYAAMLLREALQRFLSA